MDHIIKPVPGALWVESINELIPDGSKSAPSTTFQQFGVRTGYVRCLEYSQLVCPVEEGLALIESMWTAYPSLFVAMIKASMAVPTDRIMHVQYSSDGIVWKSLTAHREGK